MCKGYCLKIDFSVRSQHHQNLAYCHNSKKGSQGSKTFRNSDPLQSLKFETRASSSLRGVPRTGFETYVQTDVCI